MSIQKLLKVRMVSDKVVVFDQGGILRYLPRRVGMSAEEFSEAGHMPTCGDVIVCVFMTVEAVLLTHESVGVFLHLLANSGVILQIGLQGRVLFHEFPVVYK